MPEKFQWQILIDMFRANGGTLTTSDFGQHPKLWAEYRRALCDLRRHGFDYAAERIAPKLWRYRLIEGRTFELEPSGQMRFA